MIIPYIANYSEEHAIEPSQFNYDALKQLNITSNGEDVVNCMKNTSLGPTVITRSAEPSDPDQFILGPTAATEAIESSDQDEIFLGPTTITKSMEPSDPDYLID